jgi:nucleotide-binding universal stress UspA family protein
MYDTILVPIDGSPTAEAGLREAIRLAGQLKSRLELLYVVSDYPLMVEMTAALAFDETRRMMRGHGRDVLAKGQRQCEQAGVQATTTLREIASAHIAGAILEEAGKDGCGLIVMGTHGRRGFSRLTLGSDAELVLREAPVPVLLVRQRAAV